MQPQQVPAPPQNYQNPHQVQQPQTTKVLVPRNSNNQNGPNPNPNQPTATSQVPIQQPPNGFQFVTLGNGKVVAAPSNPNSQGYYEPQAPPQKVVPQPVNNTNQYY